MIYIIQAHTQRYIKFIIFKDQQELLEPVREPRNVNNYKITLHKPLAFYIPGKK